jgi:hypothetical protein
MAYLYVLRCSDTIHGVFEFGSPLMPSFPAPEKQVDEYIISISGVCPEYIESISTVCLLYFPCISPPYFLRGPLRGVQEELYPARN